MPGMQTEDTYESIDTNAIASEIASEMGFGEDYPENEIETGEDGAPLVKPAGEEKPLGETVPPEDQSKTTPAQPAFKALPKSWKKEMEPVWQKADPALHDYVYNREADVMRGLQQYSEGYNRWNAAVAPFQGVFQQHPHVKPEEVFQRLMQTHLGLVSGSPEQKLGLLLKIAGEYGVDLGPAKEGTTENTEALSPAVEKALRAAFGEINALKQNLSQKDAVALRAAQSENEKTVAAFAADPKNKYFEEVGDTIVKLLKTGAAADLPSAYELACYANPAVRAKIIADLKGPATPAIPQNGSKPFPNLDSSPDVRPRKQRAVSMDDTIDSIVAKYAKSNL